MLVDMIYFPMYLFKLPIIDFHVKKLQNSSYNLQSAMNKGIVKESASVVYLVFTR